jgi:S-adenosylmethionine:tRNA ribosyltransferase-isomerase
MKGEGRRLLAADFDYDCPPELIAQHPAPDRAASRLLVLDRATGRVSHRTFRDFPSLFEPGDLLVLNVSRVMPARLIGMRDNGRPAEILLVHPEPDETWLAMGHPGGKLKAGRRVRFGGAGGQKSRKADPGAAEVEIVEVLGGGLRRVRFHGMEAREVMQLWGAVPLPPYIHRTPDAADRERYQTVYAKTDGSVAAPTAGLHFTPEILEAVRARGATIAEVTLHVGPGTFKPVEADDPAEHVMHAEWYEIPTAAAEAVNQAKARARRVWAVGTTACRVLETAGRRAGGPADSAAVTAGSGWTDLFIYPPYAFRVVDALLTNFHLPRSTLLMLVAAFAGYDHTVAAYRDAVRERYRLYSYGDAMAVVSS